MEKMIFISVLFGFSCAIVAMAYTCILTEPGGLLDKWKVFLYRKCHAREIYINEFSCFKCCTEIDKQKLEVHGKILGFKHKLHDYPKLYKMLVECTACFSGQLCLWTFYFIIPYSVFGHILSISSAIVFGKILNALYIKLDRWITVNS